MCDSQNCRRSMEWNSGALRRDAGEIAQPEGRRHRYMALGPPTRVRQASQALEISQKSLDFGRPRSTLKTVQCGVYSPKRSLIGSNQMIQSMAVEIAALKKLTVSDLRGKYRELYGEETRSCNKDYLWKRCAFRMQELQYGGLSEAAWERIATLAPDGVSPGTYAPRKASRKHGGVQKPDQETPRRKRDPRLPPVGNIISREFDGALHEVIVLDEGFDYGGKTYRSLSAVARAITGSHWNGFGFFRLLGKGRR